MYQLITSLDVKSKHIVYVLVTKSSCSNSVMFNCSRQLVTQQQPSIHSPQGHLFQASFNGRLPDNRQHCQPPVFRLLK